MRAVQWSFPMQSFAWLWAICGVCSRFGKSWIGVRKGEKVLHTMEMARPVVRRGRWFRHSIYPDDHVSMAALVCTGRHVVKWPEFRAFHD